MGSNARGMGTKARGIGNKARAWVTRRGEGGGGEHRVAVNHEGPIHRVDLAFVLAVRRIVRELVCHIVNVRKGLVDSNHLRTSA